MRTFLLACGLLIGLAATSHAAITTVNPFCVGSTNGNGFTTAAISTTGATAIVVATMDYAPDPDTVVTDSAGNSYSTALTNTTAGNVQLKTYVIQNPTTSGSHTFTTASSTNPTICVMPLSGTLTASAIDTQTSNSALAASTVQPGSITPASNNEALITFFGSPDTVSSIDSPFTLEASVSSSVAHLAGGMAHDIQTTATARNPTWSWPGATDMAAAMIAIKAAGGTTPTLFHRRRAQ